MFDPRKVCDLAECIYVELHVVLRGNRVAIYRQLFIALNHSIRGLDCTIDCSPTYNLTPFHVLFTKS